MRIRRAKANQWAKTLPSVWNKCRELLFPKVDYYHEVQKSGFSKSPFTQRTNTSDRINEYRNPLLNCFFLRMTAVIKTNTKWTNKSKATNPISGKSILGLLMQTWVISTGKIVNPNQKRNDGLPPSKSSSRGVMIARGNWCIKQQFVKVSPLIQRVSKGQSLSQPIE